MDSRCQYKESSDDLPVAHIKEDDSSAQSVKEHCENVAALAENFAPEWLKTAARQCGLYHDVGKYSKEFQQYIRGQYTGRVDHSTAGAQLLVRNKTCASIFEALCIAGHHAGLPDMGTRMSPSDSSEFMGRLKRRIPDFSSFRNELGTPLPVDTLKLSGIPIWDALTARMLFSCLVDADFLDTESFMSGSKNKRTGFHTIAEIHDIFFKELERKGFFSPDKPINMKRCEILQRCIRSAEDEPGLFSLTVPTGGGKTVSSFAFALEHAVRHHKKRIIYVIPYTSIIEQTAAVFQSFVGTGDIVEHHSQVEYNDETEEMQRRRLATENWDAPLIVTTNVQFLESLFANKTSRCRKLHNIAGSVIVMDEAQMLPVAYLKPVLTCLEALVKNFSCSIVLCSATQPHLDRFLTIKPRELMSDIPELYAFFKRTVFKKEGRKNYDEIATEIDNRQQTLCICLTKDEAREIFQRVKGNCAYLSTNLCPAHRHQVIEKMKQLLKDGKTCRVVSTSVISVGVDIDFPEVFLEENGIDSLIQGAGRCNRENKNPVETSIVHVFETEKSAKSRFMHQERQCTDSVSNDFDDISDPQAIQEYFDRLYEAKNEGLDEKEIVKLSQEFNFVQIDKKMRIIENNTKTLFIPWNDEAREIEKELLAGIRTRNLMRRAGQYSVSVWSNPSRKKTGLYEQMLNEGAAEPLDDEMAVLRNLEYYDERMGLCYKHEEGIDIFM